MIKTKKRLGFTVIEMLVVVIVTAILVAIIMLAYGAMIDKSEATACLANRKTIQKAYQFYRLDTPQPKSLDIFLKNENSIADIWLDSKISCPTKGKYSVSQDIIICSIHSQSGGSVPNNIIPGTTNFGGGGFVADDDWEDTFFINTNNNRSMIGFEIGQKFLYEGKYYIAVETLPAIDDQGNNDPGQSVWWTMKGAGGLVQLTGVSKNWDAIPDATRFFRGDILFYDGDYYVCKVQGSTGFIDITKNMPTQWNPNPYNNTPDLPGEASTWYKMEN